MKRSAFRKSPWATWLVLLTFSGQRPPGQVFCGDDAGMGLPKCLKVAVVLCCWHFLLSHTAACATSQAPLPYHSFLQPRKHRNSEGCAERPFWCLLHPAWPCTALHPHNWLHVGAVSSNIKDPSEHICTANSSAKESSWTASCSVLLLTGWRARGP